MGDAGAGFLDMLLISPGQRVWWILRTLWHRTGVDTVTRPVDSRRIDHFNRRQPVRTAGGRLFWGLVPVV